MKRGPPSIAQQKRHPQGPAARALPSRKSFDGTPASEGAICKEWLQSENIATSQR